MSPQPNHKSLKSISNYRRKAMKTVNKVKVKSSFTLAQESVEAMDTINIKVNEYKS